MLVPVISVVLVEVALVSVVPVEVALVSVVPVEVALVEVALVSGIVTEVAPVLVVEVAVVGPAGPAAPQAASASVSTNVSTIKIVVRMFTKGTPFLFSPVEQVPFTAPRRNAATSVPDGGNNSAPREPV